MVMIVSAIVLVLDVVRTAQKHLGVIAAGLTHEHNHLQVESLNPSAMLRRAAGVAAALGAKPGT